MERYHWFLNKIQVISGADRGTHSVILQNAKISQYALNIAPINNTNIQRIYVAVIRAFRFLLDVKLNPAPALNSVNNGGGCSRISGMWLPTQTLHYLSYTF